MEQKRDFLIRNMPVEVYDLLEKAAKEHRRSKTQEAIIALKKGLTISAPSIKKPTPFKWKNTISTEFIQKAIEEGRP